MSENKIKLLLREIEKSGDISELVINDYDKVFVERNSVFSQLNVKLNKSDLQQFISDVSSFNKKNCDQNNPIFDGLLEDGSRVNIVLPPFVRGVPAITIRKFSNFHESLELGLKKFQISSQWRDFFKALISARMNFVICGGTSTGKTSFLNMLLTEIQPSERLIIIEDTPELKINHSNCVRMSLLNKGAGKNINLEMSDLVKNSLRMRPDRIIIGEVRSKEFVDLVDSMNTGHDGSVSTLHASSSGDCLSRMENLYLMGSREMPLRFIRSHIKSAINYIIHLDKNKNGQRHVKEIREITGMEGDIINSQLIAKYQDEDLKILGVAPESMELLVQEGNLDKGFFS